MTLHRTKKSVSIYRFMQTLLLFELSALDTRNTDTHNSLRSLDLQRHSRRQWAF